MKEIERRFLLKSIPEEIKDVMPVEIEDIMLLTGEPHPHLRLRKKDDHRELTKKYRPENAAVNEMIEETIALSRVEFETLKQLNNYSQRKKRYVIEKVGYKIELDLWMDDLKGLGIVEFEFDDKDNADSFVAPSYCLVEITGIESLAGGMISGKKYEDIEAILNGYNYRRINV